MREVDEAHRRYFVGVDLGQRHDYTAVAVVERADWVGERDYVTWGWKKERRLSVRHLERMKLGTPYPEVVTRVRQMVRAPDLQGRCTLVVDATGVGVPVVDMFWAADLGCAMAPVQITYGSHETFNKGFYGVPKRDLVVGLQVKFDEGMVRIAAGLAEGEVLIKELMDMRVKVSAAGHEGFGAWREGTHDDFLLALALACWRAGKAEVGWKGEDLGVY
jgi:phage FluMu gp28-like protein